MSANDRFERRLPVILDSLAPTRAPEYFDDILGQVDRTRQRPGWTFPERWLPVSALTNRLAVTPRIPMRAAIAVMLLIVGLVVGALLLAGSRQRVPAPFGPAANGQIMFIDEDGAIRSGNPRRRHVIDHRRRQRQSTAHHVAGRHPPRVPVGERARRHRSAGS